MVEILICPHIENCILYKNWSKESKDNRLGIIQSLDNGYDCLALIATQDPPSEGGVPVDEGLLKRLPENNSPMVYQCSHIQTLNLLKKIK